MKDSVQGRVVQSRVEFHFQQDSENPRPRDPKLAIQTLQSDQSLFSAYGNFTSSASQNVPSEISDHTAKMCRLSWIFTVRAKQLKVHFL